MEEGRGIGLVERVLSFGGGGGKKRKEEGVEGAARRDDVHTGRYLHLSIYLTWPQ